MSTPLFIAHRGDAQQHAENSLAALTSALAAGVRFIECDVQINASGTPVLLHDANLQRTHACELPVFEHHDGQQPRLPTVAEVLQLAADYPEAVFFFEIKYDSIDHWGASQVLERLAVLRQGIGHHVLLNSSFDFVAGARETGYPSVGVILRGWSSSIHGRLAELSPDYAIINRRRVPDGASLWPGRWRWAVYEVGDLATAADWGVRGAEFAISFNAVELTREQLALGGA